MASYVAICIRSYILTNERLSQLNGFKYKTYS